MDLRSGTTQLRWYILAFFMLLTACQKPLKSDNSGYNQNPEAAYCGSAQATSYAGDTTTVSGTANFQYRALSTSGCTGLCGDPSSLGITYAEVHVVDSTGTILQCGETNHLGAFSLVIPRVAGSYKVQVLSRSFTDKVKASILKDIYAAAPYVIESDFSVTAAQSTVSGLALTATARASEGDGTVPGGAFNILANIFWANEFLRANISNPSFVADKVSVFWQAGFNPYSYFDAPNVSASFYVNTEDRLYILGGKNGDVKVADTDHFDDSVILHEYAHFLEGHYGRSDTPGGSHNGNFIIDPRLAWSEGWANYFQATVQNKTSHSSEYAGPKKSSAGFSGYLDTAGFKNDTAEGSGAGAGILISRNLNELNSAAAYDKSVTNEGIFREFSISRSLFKSTTNAGAIPFAAVWDAFKELRNTGSPAYKFVNFGLYNSVLQGILNSATYAANSQTTWNTVLSEEFQVKDTGLYGRHLGIQAPSGGSPSCPETALSPVADATYPNSYERSNQLMSNDFFTYYHDGSSKKIGLKNRVTGAAVIDMNLYVYTDDYYYSEEVQESQANFSNSTMARRARTINLSSGTETEVVDMTGLAAGYYMINVKASTVNKTSAALNGTSNYYLYIGDSTTVNTCLVPN